MPTMSEDTGTGRDRRPVLQPIANLGNFGLEAMDIIQYKGNTPKGWAKQASAAVEAAKQQGGRTEIMVVSAVEKLVNKATGKQ